jgi:hypothetical protein
MVTGEKSDTWGDITNSNLGTLLEQAVSGYVTQAVATGTDTTITIPDGSTGVARNMYIELTGTGGAATNLIVPAKRKLYFIYNNTASGQVTVKVSGQTGVSVANGKKVILVCDGTDVELATSFADTDNAESRHAVGFDAHERDGAASYYGCHRYTAGSQWRHGSYEQHRIRKRGAFYVSRAHDSEPRHSVCGDSDERHWIAVDHGRDGHATCCQWWYWRYEQHWFWQRGAFHVPCFDDSKSRHAVCGNADQCDGLAALDGRHRNVGRDQRRYGPNELYQRSVADR